MLPARKTASETSSAKAPSSGEAFADASFRRNASRDRQCFPRAFARLCARRACAGKRAARIPGPQSRRGRQGFIRGRCQRGVQGSRESRQGFDKAGARGVLRLPSPAAAGLARPAAASLRQVAWKRAGQQGAALAAAPCPSFSGRAGRRFRPRSRARSSLPTRLRPALPGGSLFKTSQAEAREAVRSSQEKFPRRVAASRVDIAGGGLSATCLQTRIRRQARRAAIRRLRRSLAPRGP